MTTKILKNIKYSTLIAFIATVATNIYIILASSDFNMFFELPIKGRIFTMFSTVGFAFLASLFKFSFIIVIFICVTIAEKKIKKDQLSKVDIKDYDGYFRDVLININPLELSYIDDFKLEYPKDYVAILLSLKRRKIIDFGNSKIDILIHNTESLTLAERYILDHINAGKLDSKVDNLTFYSCVQRDAYNKGLLKKNSKISSKLKLKHIFILFLIVFLYTYLGTYLNNENLITWHTIIGILLILLLFITLFILPFYFIIYGIKSSLNPYIRTLEGEAINKKIEGLKNYLKDFSIMEKREVNDILVWDDYLIYSVLFNQNKNIVDQVYNSYFIKK